MKLEIQQPNKSLNKAYLKEKVGRNEIEVFKTNLKTLLSKINETESEEHHKYPVSDFLKDTWYKDRYEINTKSHTDFVIHNGKTTSDSVGVIIEVKSPSNHTEMISEAKPNKKAMHELIFYYLRERVDKNQTEIKQLIITNILEWYIFDEAWFEKYIFRSRLKKEYETYRHSGKDTRFFYDSIAKPFLDELEEAIPCTYFDFSKFEKIVNNQNKQDDNKLIALYKVLSPAHLLKQPFANDSNSLDTKFYSELLHIIGLEEVKDGGKKLIRRKEKPDAASLLENAIMKLEDKDCLRDITNLTSYGSGRKEQLFNVALELCITWINRILFIKLLEGQLVTYHKGNKDYLFLNIKIVGDFDELNNLFFQVLAERSDARREHLKEKFNRIPYLNSSLFERTALERETIQISDLENRLELPVSLTTVLKNDTGKKQTGKSRTLNYLFDFLDAYDFSSDGGEEIQEENKNLINASVLGLIFEKINGYKDGSFFTPGFITMYMCHETIRRAVLQKFKEAKEWECETLEQLYDKIQDKKEANEIINSLKICDPAVGSGHFLVSALNEIIAVKSELKILLDKQGKTLRDYNVEVVNDELVITDEDGLLLDYNPNNKESQRIQETLFHEKETIIENCLFGVDINPNSVKICRLRLWIELLKNAYYTSESNYKELETLPNIDINIKSGNSLISRFALDADLSKALKKSKWTIDSYRLAVQTYRNAQSKNEKREMEQLIDSIKTNFRKEISDNDPKIKRLQKLNTDYYLKYQADKLFDAKLTSAQKKDKLKKETEIEKLETEIREIKSDKIYERAFEWRFEFPEILDDEGMFIGFDVIIGNPPYGILPNKLEKKVLFSSYPSTEKFPDSYCCFMVLAKKLLRPMGDLTFIIPNTFCDLESCVDFRKWILTELNLNSFWQTGFAFENAVVDTLAFFARNSKVEMTRMTIKLPNEEYTRDTASFMQNDLSKFDYRNNEYKNQFLKKIIEKTIRFGSIGSVKAGVKLYEIGKGNPAQTKVTLTEKPFTKVGGCPLGWRPLVRGSSIDKYVLKKPNEYINYGEWLAAPREEHSFHGNRILMRRTDDRILATYINDDSVCANSCHIIKLFDEEIHSYKSILAILNSRLIQWIFEIQNPQMIGKTFSEIKVVYISNLPFPHIVENNLELEKLVDSILMLKWENEDANIVNLQDNIDKIIYQLYSLSDNEIKMLEAS
ncbi:MAG: TaqI-like C-terminal specificity domain-containing protein [Flavipsychrobacter sp.]|nr:TaqI-like C-terminal specificity domain-containing protein [Flavipsychrobacter sp.]